MSKIKAKYKSNGVLFIFAVLMLLLSLQESGLLYRSHKAHEEVAKRK